MSSTWLHLKASDESQDGDWRHFDSHRLLNSNSNFLSRRWNKLVANGELVQHNKVRHTGCFNTYMANIVQYRVSTCHIQGYRVFQYLWLTLYRVSTCHIQGVFLTYRVGSVHLVCRLPACHLHVMLGVRMSCRHLVYRVFSSLDIQGVPNLM